MKYDLTSFKEKCDRGESFTTKDWEKLTNIMLQAMIGLNEIDKKLKSFGK